MVVGFEAHFKVDLVGGDMVLVFEDKGCAEQFLRFYKIVNGHIFAVFELSGEVAVGDAESASQVAHFQAGQFREREGVDDIDDLFRQLVLIVHIHD